MPAVSKLALAGLLLAGCRSLPGVVEVAEPMVFDLVRGLGAKQGELEVNALAILPLSSGDPAAPEIAPEIEYAVIDGLAFELELPFEEGGLFSVKAAGQYTFGTVPDKGFIHGVQAIVERLVEVDAWDLTLLYIPAVRFDGDWSLLAMVGASSLLGPEVDDDLGLLANATLFLGLQKDWTLGFEIDSAFFRDAGSSVLLMPQVHWQISELFTLQFGVGVLYVDGTIAAGSDLIVTDRPGWYPQLALRAVFEF